MAFLYTDIFKSIQGEGLDTGLPCIFIRLATCNLNCSYCDVDKTCKEKSYNVKNMLAQIHKLKIKRVCITGGEPLMQEDTLPLVYELLADEYKVSIETNGAIPIDKDYHTRSFRYIMDIKTPSSGMSDKNILENIFALQKRDEIKFVISNMRDYEFAKKIIKQYPIYCSILFSPVDCDLNLGKILATKIIQDGLEDVRIQLQQHKILGIK